MFRPGLIEPQGIKSKTKLVRISYMVMEPLLPLVRAAFPKYVTTTERMGRAMLAAAKRGAPKRVGCLTALGMVARTPPSEPGRGLD
jgi:hypothetical protein